MKTLLQKLGFFKEQKKLSINDRVRASYLNQYTLIGKIVSTANNGYYIMELERPVRMFGTMRWYATVNKKEIKQIA